MRSETKIAFRHQTFLAAKTVRPVPHAGGLVHDALVQCCLDAEVLQIDFRRPAESAASGLAAFEFISVLRRDGAYFLDIVPARPLRSLSDHDRIETMMARLGLRPLTITAGDIMREPRFSAARTVWRHRHFRTTPETRQRIVRALSDEVSLSIDELCTLVPGPQEPMQSVMSMACADLVEIEIKNCPIGLKTKVRSRI